VCVFFKLDVFMATTVKVIFVQEMTPSCCVRETCCFAFQATTSTRISCDFYKFFPKSRVL